MRARDHADKVGIFGAVFAALCCLGIPAVLGIVTAIGAGFLINDAILLPLLVLSLLVTLWGLVSGRRRHHNPTAILVGILGGVGLFVFSFIHQSRGLALTSIVVLVAASIINVVLLRGAGDKDVSTFSSRGAT